MKDLTKMTTKEVRQMADREAKSMLSVPSAAHAFKMLERGELRGTVAEAELSMLRAMIKGKRK